MFQMNNGVGSMSAKISFLLCLVVYCLHCSAANDCNETEVTSHILCKEFLTLRNVIPIKTLRDIVACHFDTDSKFRHAVEFMKTAEYRMAAAQIDASDSYQQILIELQSAKIDTYTISTMANITDCLLLPVTDDDDEVLDWDHIARGRMESRSLQTFANDILKAIPKEKFRNVLDKLVANNAEFGRFVAILRNSAFRRQVMRGLASRQLSAPLRIMKRNYIDIRKLVDTGLNIFAI